MYCWKARTNSNKNSFQVVMMINIQNEFVTLFCLWFMLLLFFRITVEFILLLSLPPCSLAAFSLSTLLILQARCRFLATKQTKKVVVVVVVFVSVLYALFIARRRTLERKEQEQKWERMKNSMFDVTVETWLLIGCHQHTVRTIVYCES